jgi:hypothetical protein
MNRMNTIMIARITPMIAHTHQSNTEKKSPAVALTDKVFAPLISAA